ncbi:MAG: succinate dehydrogenase, cytochrome b556 subunit, partial [Alphaproteobacteria bacterium]|nr:succinate dehydrogenase, cytochrome b556 subunit [Alphaproteobacteria bacterium]
RSRPLSPHLQVYRLQWTMLLSITHRITGVGLTVAGVLLFWWLMALASGPEYFALVQALLASTIGRLMLLGWTWAMFYHLCNGIRHLCWDAGWGFELDTARNTGLLVLAGSILLTVGSWMAIYAMRGA